MATFLSFPFLRGFVLLHFVAPAVSPPLPFQHGPILLRREETKGGRGGVLVEPPERRFSLNQSF